MAVRPFDGSSTTVRLPAALPVPAAGAYVTQPGPNGTKILTEPVDPLSLAVPAGWATPSADPLTLPGELDKFAQEAPPLAALVQAEGQVATRSAVRLFAYQAAPPHAFVSVISFSSPGVNALTPSEVDALVASARQKTPNVAVSGVQLPVGRVLQLESSLVSQNTHLVIQDLILIAGGRTMLIQMVGETNVAAVPPVFDQIAKSLRLG